MICRARSLGAPSRRLALISCCVALAAGLAVSGCAGATGSSGSGPTQTLTLYNAQHEETTAALIKSFTAQTGIHVRVKSDDEDVLTAQLEQEGSRSPADIFYTENSNWLQQLDDRGLLAKVDASTLASVPRRDSASNGAWLGVSGRFSVLVYNPSKVSAGELPTSVLALASPKYKGMLELAPAETDFWPIVTSVARADGHAAALSWLKGLKANAGANDNAPDNETLLSDVSNGGADIGLINHYYYYRLRAEIGASSVHARLSLLAPRDPGYVEDISGAAILKSSKHLAAAQKFLAFIVSAAGQRVLAHGTSFEYPLAGNVAANPLLPPVTTLQPNAITPAEIGTGLDARDLLREAGLI
jgi:iron(III) transport system substrate-binding protein